jgi:hypothetical protein
MQYPFAFNPTCAARPKHGDRRQANHNGGPTYAELPRIPLNATPVPHLTSLYHFHRADEYGDHGYPGNCGDNLIRDLPLYFKPRSAFDLMAGSGTYREVRRELRIACTSDDDERQISYLTLFNKTARIVTRATPNGGCRKLCRPSHKAHFFNTCRIFF